ncbi:MAG TPA: LytTR family DNA-binding domain-containing protein [Flavisolibacter sp.]|jgi:two-component system LytT family response regulator|nr:LytTR family DNA-binding domain-containing protein [Flavisolibacter sp.]
MQMNKTDAVLLLPTDRGTKIILVNTLIRVEAISNYSKLYFSNGSTLVVARVLRRFEVSLMAGHFLRIHRSHLVNKLWLRSLDYNDGCRVSLQNGDVLPVSRRRVKSLVVNAGSTSAAPEAPYT